MVQYKSTYFDGRGRAELSRLIFAAAGVQYEDVRIDHEKWPTIKPSKLCSSLLF
jgi:prostaglandin-H2 D-isomerase / glutathione transferase